MCRPLLWLGCSHHAPRDERRSTVGQAVPDSALLRQAQPDLRLALPKISNLILSDSLVRRQLRLLACQRVVAPVDGGVAHGPVTVKLFALVVTGNEGNVDATLCHVASLKTEPRVRIGPALEKLPGVAGRLRAINMNAVDDLHGTSRVDVAAEEDVDVGGLQPLPETLPVWWIDGKVPVVIFIGAGKVPGGFVRLLHEGPIMHHRNVHPQARWISCI